MAKFEKDLTHGNMFKQLILFAIPFFLSNLIQSAYSVADMVILGHYGGTNSISAVNTSGQVMIIITNLATGIATGGTVMLGQYLGANKKHLINDTISTMLLTLMGLGVILGGVTFAFINPLLNVLNVPDGAFDGARSYLMISTLGILFIYGYNALSAIMRGLGDSKTPLIFVAIAGVVNVLLDLLLVGKFNQGAKGAAVATITSQGLSMLLCIIYLKINKFQFDFRLSSFRMDRSKFFTLLKVGLPNGVQQVCTNFSFLFLTAMINKIGGEVAGAASGVVNKFNSFAILPTIAISASVSAMISQNVGAGKGEHVKKVTRYGFVLGAVICVIVFVIANTCYRGIFKMFDAEPDVVEVGIKYIHAFSFEYVGLPVIVAFNSVFIGTGNGWISLITNLISSFAVRMPVAYLLGSALGYGVTGIGCSIPIATAAGAIIAGIFYISGVWKKNQVDLK